MVVLRVDNIQFSLNYFHLQITPFSFTDHSWDIAVIHFNYYYCFKQLSFISIKTKYLILLHFRLQHTSFLYADPSFWPMSIFLLSEENQHFSKGRSDSEMPQQVFIFPSLLEDNFAGYRMLGFFFFFLTLRSFNYFTLFWLTWFWL